MTDAPTLPAPAGRRVRRLYIPLFCVLVPTAGFALFTAANRTDLGDGMIFTSQMLFQFSLMLGVLGLSVWFFLLGGLPGRLRLAGLLLLVAAVGTAVATIKTVEFDGQMNPTVRTRWDADPAKIAAEYRAAAVKAEAAPDLIPRVGDSTLFRNFTGTGAVAGLKLEPDWAKSAPKLLWKHPVGNGLAGVAVAGNSAVTIEQIDDTEAVVCYDRATGKERWTYAYPAAFTHTQAMGGSGPRTTPAVIDGDVISLGGAGDLVCLAGSNGGLKWRVNIFTDNDADNPEWGMSASPLVVGTMVIVNPGAKKGAATGEKAVVAYDRTTGKKKWTAAAGRAAYASPMRATLGGRDFVLVFDAAGLAAFDPISGKREWAHPWKTPMDMNSAQPVVVGPNLVLLSSEKDNGTAVLDVTPAADGTITPRVKWKNRRFAARYATPAFYAGHIFGLCDGRLHCLDAETGVTKWAEGNFGNGQILRADDVFVVTNEKGGIHLVAADPAGFRELGKFPVFGDRTWNMPALAQNYLFVRNHREMACVELPTVPKE